VLNTDATLDDVARSSDEMEAWFEAHRDTHPVLVADLDGAIVGYGALSLFAHRGGYRVGAEISVYVAPAWQRAGVGTALCRALAAHAEESDLVSVTALISESNIGARRLFESAGYEHQGGLRRMGAKFGRLVDLEIYQWFGAGPHTSSKSPKPHGGQRMTSAAFDSHVARQPMEVARLLDQPVPELDRGRPIIFTGIGTSLHACRVAATWMRMLSGGSVRALAIDAHDLALYEGVTGKDQVVVVSHRGTKRYPQAAIEAALDAGGAVVAISGQGAPAHEGVTTIETCEQEIASTHTVSYASSLSVLARMACAALGDDDARPLADALPAVPEAMAATLELPLDTAAVEALAQRAPAPILLAGAGLDAITAEEAALKIKEGAYRWSEGLHTEFALHGTPAVYDACLSAILIRSGEDGGRGADLEGVLAAVGASTFECSDQAGCEFPFAPVAAIARPFATILPLQRLVSGLAARNGASPDQTHLEVEPWRSAILGVNL